MRPVVHGLDQRYGERVAFASANFYSRDNRGLIERYRVLGYPTIVLLDKDGTAVKRFVGLTDAGALETAIGQVAGGTR